MARSFRSRNNRVLAVVLSALGAIVASVILTDREVNAAGDLVAVVLVLFEATIAVRFWRSGLDVYDDRVVVRGIVRSHRLSGDDITRVQLKPGGFLGWQCPEVITRDGRRIRVEVPTSPKWLTSRSEGPPVLHALRQVAGLASRPPGST